MGRLSQWAALWTSGPLFSPWLVERVGTASRCLQLVCQQLATQPLRYRGAPTSTEPLWVANPDPAWFPNGIGEAVFAIAWSLYSYGDAFLWVTSRYADGYPRTWTVLDPAAIQVSTSGGIREYQSGGVWFDPVDILQIPRTPNGQLRGTSALAAYASNLTAASAAEEFAADIYKSGGVPWGALKPTRRLTAVQAAELQGQWMDRVAARVAAPAVLPPDVVFEQFQFNPRDLALLETREWDAKQIAAAFGVPAFMINMEQAGGLNYSNPEMLFTTWWRTELYPVAHRIDSALSTWIPRGQWVEFDPSATLRPDLSTMATTWLNLLDKGAVTVDELRAAVLDLPPIEAGEALELLDQPPGAKGTPLDSTVAAVPRPLEAVQ